MIHWIWEQTNWPNFYWDEAAIATALAQARLQQGKLLGQVQGFNEPTQEQLTANALLEEVITSSAIEGETLDRGSVRSSIANRLALPTGTGKQPTDRYIEGMLDIMLDAAQQHQKPLTLERLCGWQAALFPTGYSGIQKILVGELRGEGDMKIISGRPGKTKTHYVAPPHDSLPREMNAFLAWFEATKPHKKETPDGIVRAAVAHLWFELLHPFDDGNGRVGRAIADMALAQDEQLPTRFYSLSSEIMANRKQYYAILEASSKGDLDITPWITWFLNCYQQAVAGSLQSIQIIVQKSLFWQHLGDTPLNERQIKALNRLLDAGQAGFEGGMTTRKYMAITRLSRAQAYRELQDLVQKGCLAPLPGKGRSAAYQIKYGTGIG